MIRISSVVLTTFLLIMFLFVPAFCAEADDLDSLIQGLQKEFPDPGDIVPELSKTFGFPASELNALREKIQLSAGDLFILTSIAHKLGHPLGFVAESFGKSKGHGWGEIAKSMGIKPGSAEFHELKNTMQKNLGSFSTNGKTKGKKAERKTKKAGHKTKGNEQAKEQEKKGKKHDK